MIERSKTTKKNDQVKALKTNIIDNGKAKFDVTKPVLKKPAKRVNFAPTVYTNKAPPNLII